MMDTHASSAVSSWPSPHSIEGKATFLIRASVASLEDEMASLMREVRSESVTLNLLFFAFLPFASSTLDLAAVFFLPL